MRRRSVRGVTVLELIIVAFIVLLVGLGIALTLSRTSSQLWSRTDVRINSWASAQQAMNHLEADLRQASWKTVTCGTPPLEFRRVTQPGTLLSYSTNASRQLIRGNGIGTPEVLARDIIGFECNASNGLVRVELIAQATAATGIAATQTLMRQIRVQNP